MNITISKHRLSELTAKEVECHKLQKHFNELDKGTQNLLLKLDRYERALNTIAWRFGRVGIESGRMSEIAKKALYKE